MTIHAPPSGLLRRFGAMFYDAILLLAVIIFATLPVVIIHGLVFGAPPAGELWFSIYLLLVGYLYFAWFWTHGGQTLGMRTWRLVIIRDDGSRPGWRDCLIRYVVALCGWIPAGAGYFWALFDSEKRTLHDIASGTSLVVLPRTLPSDDTAEG